MATMFVNDHRFRVQFLIMAETFILTGIGTGNFIQKLFQVREDRDITVLPY
jgi:hypothetical protein